MKEKKEKKEKRESAEVSSHHETSVSGGDFIQPEKVTPKLDTSK